MYRKTRVLIGNVFLPSPPMIILNIGNNSIIVYCIKMLTANLFYLIQNIVVVTRDQIFESSFFIFDALPRKIFTGTYGNGGKDEIQ